MDSRYGIHTIELFHRVSKKDFNKVFHSLKSMNSGNFYPDTTYHSEKGLTKYICTSYCGQGIVLYLYQQVRSKNKTKKNLHLLFIFGSILILYCTESMCQRKYSRRKKNSSTRSTRK